MATTVHAVYQNGVLRPTQPLPLAEGEAVEITVVRAKDTPPALAEDEAIQRIRAARTLEEWIAAANAAPAEEDDYDLLRALDENRQFSGDYRPLFPPEGEGAPR
jgi:predicted DNA-binding antitoxin AbrB/MazE fold protein